MNSGISELVNGKFDRASGALEMGDIFPKFAEAANGLNISKGPSLEVGFDVTREI